MNPPPAVNPSARYLAIVRAVWWGVTLLGGAALVLDLWWAHLRGATEASFRSTWLHEYRSWALWWLLLPAIVLWRQRLAFERFGWALVLGGHVLGAAAAALAEFLLSVTLVIVANTLPLSFVGEVARDLWHWPEFVFGTLHYAALVVPIYAVEFYWNWRTEQRRAADLKIAKAELEAQLLRANLDALKMQLHPHFLFNALNSIAALIRRSDTVLAEDALAQLGDLLRRALHHRQDQQVTLESELEFLDRYFAIERIRFQDRLQVEFDIAAECRRAVVPSLLLQPLVENAMKHGFSRDAAARVLRLRAERRGDELRLELFNEGPSLPAAAPSGTGGIGLRNTRARLEMLFGVRAQLVLENAPGGVSAAVTLPFTLSAA